MKYLTSFFKRKPKGDIKINPPIFLNRSIEDYDGVIREVEYFTTKEIDIVNREVKCGSLITPRLLLNNNQETYLILITFAHSRPYTDNTNHYEIKKFRNLYTLSGYKYNSHFNDIGEACEVINNRLVTSKVYYALGVEPQQYGHYEYSDISKLVSEYSVIRNNKVNEFRLREITDELGVNFEYVIQRLNFLRVGIE